MNDTLPTAALCSWCDLLGEPLPSDLRVPCDLPGTRACPAHMAWMRDGGPVPVTPGSIAAERTLQVVA